MADYTYTPDATKINSLIGSLQNGAKTVLSGQDSDDSVRTGLISTLDRLRDELSKREEGALNMISAVILHDYNIKANLVR